MHRTMLTCYPVQEPSSNTGLATDAGVKHDPPTRRRVTFRDEVHSPPTHPPTALQLAAASATPLPGDQPSASRALHKFWGGVGAPSPSATPVALSPYVSLQHVLASGPSTGHPSYPASPAIASPLEQRSLFPAHSMASPAPSAWNPTPLANPTTTPRATPYASSTRFAR